MNHDGKVETVGREVLVQVVCTDKIMYEQQNTL